MFDVKKTADEIARLWFVSADPSRTVMISREIYDYAAFARLDEGWRHAAVDDVVAAFELAAVWNMFRIVDEPGEEKMRAAAELLRTAAAETGAALAE